MPLDVAGQVATVPELADPGGDGRHRRRHDNRQAVVDALLSLYDAGEIEPSIADIAAVAGLSARSVFRYFDDVDDLARAAIVGQQERLAPHFELDIGPSLPLEAKLAQFVRHRIELIGAMGQVGRIARIRAASQPPVATELRRVRAELRRQVAEIFAPELAAHIDGAATRLAALDVVCSFEAVDLLQHDQGLAPSVVIDTMSTAVRSILESGQS